MGKAKEEEKQKEEDKKVNQLVQDRKTNVSRCLYLVQGDTEREVQRH